MVILSDLDEILHGKVVEIVSERLYFASFIEHPPEKYDNVKFFYIEDKVHYEPFYKDFGPLNLSVLYRFCGSIHRLVEARSKKKVVVYTFNDEENRVNGAYLLGAYLIIFHGATADSAYLRLEKAQPPKFIGFRDAAMGEPTYLLHLHDVLRSVEKALQLKWLDFPKFDADEYEYYERVENGDLNWIIPGKVMSFCGPHNESRVEDGYPYHSPELYFDYFRETGVSAIIRLNMKMYDAERFVDAGFEHYDLFFVDGSTPSEEIVLKFIRIVDETKGAVAVHCKAGLGRTGTLIACWMMKEYGLTAAECMAWLRICRPGSVIGPQQEYLVDMQKFCWRLSDNNTVHVPKTPTGDRKVKRLTNKVDEIWISPSRTAATQPDPFVKSRNGSAAMNGNIPSSGMRAATSRPHPTILPLRTRPPVVLNAPDRINNNGKTKDLQDEQALDEYGRSQGDRLLSIKAKTQQKLRENGSPSSIVSGKKSVSPQTSGGSSKTDRDLLPPTSNNNISSSSRRHHYNTTSTTVPSPTTAADYAMPSYTRSTTRIAAGGGGRSSKSRLFHEPPHHLLDYHSSTTYQPKTTSTTPSHHHSSAYERIMSNLRYSSPTTPVKPLSPITSPARVKTPRNIAAALSGNGSAPISRVTVAAAGSASRTSNGYTTKTKHSMTPSPLTSPNSPLLPPPQKAYRTSAGSALRLRPYPTQGVRVELEPNVAGVGCYELRSKVRSPLSEQYASRLPPNDAALITVPRDRKKRSSGA